MSERHSEAVRQSNIRRTVNIVGQKFGSLTVIGRAPWPKGNNKTAWLCRCDCGGQGVFWPSHLKRGSAGCKACHMDRMADSHRKHGGFHRGHRERLYRIWAAMRERCRNPNNKKWRIYGGRGIKVCDEWQDYAAFRAWAHANGYADGLAIDRADPWKDYCPANCSWVTKQENGRTSGRVPKGWDSRFPPSTPIEMLMGLC